MKALATLIVTLLIVPSCTLTSYYPGVEESFGQKSPYYYNYNGYVPYRAAPNYLPPYPNRYAPYPYHDQDNYYSTPYSYQPQNRVAPNVPMYPSDNDGAYYYNYPPAGNDNSLNYYNK